MTFVLSISLCFVLMLLVASVAYYFGWKKYKRLIKYVPFMTLASGFFFFIIKIIFMPKSASFFGHIYDLLFVFIFGVLGVIAIIEALVVDILEGKLVSEERLRLIYKRIQSMDIPKRFKLWIANGKKFFSSQ